VHTYLIGGAVALGAAYFIGRSFRKPTPETWAFHTPRTRNWASLRPGLASVSSPLFGISDLRRMVALQTRTGGVLIFSATCVPEDELKEHIESMGPVELIVVPCGMHRLDGALWKARYPKAAVVCPAAARAKVEQKIPVDEVYEDVFAHGNRWGITHHPAPMKPGFEESALEVPVGLDGDECALLIVDIIQNVDTQSWFAPLRWIASLYKIAGDGAHITMSHGFRHWCSAGGVALMKHFVEQLESQAHKHKVTALFVGHGQPVLHNVADQLKDLKEKL
jgi:hypothetical protein